MNLIVKPAGVYQANCYIVYDEKTMEGFIIDPGGDAPDISNILKEKGILAKFIILTHGHFDHIGAVNELKKKLNIPVYMNKNDLFLVSEDDAHTKSAYHSHDNIKVDRFVNDGDVIKYGNETISIVETPGHSRGSITIYTDGCLFTGDTLFAGSAGRTDFPGGSQDMLLKSLSEKIALYPDETRVYPGHGPSTTIGIEKSQNPFL